MTGVVTAAEASQHASVRDLASRFTELDSAPLPDLRALTDEDLKALDREDEIMREVLEIAYLYRQPYILDASDTEHLLSVSASSLDTMIKDTLRNRAGNNDA
jgi:hypothetical protein